jgi:hypothetical protein
LAIDFGSVHANICFRLLLLLLLLLLQDNVVLETLSSSSFSRTTSVLDASEETPSRPR